ncbi:unnamed protein product [Brassicogethes aeneus]|uniref:Regulatory protein zeste n=1 Tax=Brassicogethes aeneus TaxID=1431903 RepID=A0A9P0APF4_BRAAE|nr:unnamed protein product [Brassicogethes aeneus]
MATNAQKKRGRAPNFSPQERDCLLNLVHKYKHIVCNTKTDGASNDLKTKYWKKITEEFNASSPTAIFRETDSLHRFFLNTVQTTRKVAAEDKRMKYLTGGGPPKKQKLMTKTLFWTLSIPKLLRDWNRPSTEPAKASEQEIYFVIDGERELPTVCEEYEEISAEINHVDIDYGDNVDGTIDNNPIDNDSIMKNIDTTNWARYSAKDLTKPISKPLKPTPKSTPNKPARAQYDASRRRPAVTALTTSHVAEMYEELLKYRIEIAKIELARVQALQQYEADEAKYKLERLRLENNHIKRKMAEEAKLWTT